MDCKVCNSAVSKYKCPSCRIPYCSLACWKTHKSVECDKVPATPSTITPAEPSNTVIPETPAATYNFPTEDTVPPEKLKELGDNQQLKDILCNPHVRAIISSLDKATNPRQLLHEAMQEPIFVEFVDECMRTVNPPSKEELEEAMMQL